MCLDSYSLNEQCSYVFFAFLQGEYLQATSTDNTRKHCQKLWTVHHRPWNSLPQPQLLLCQATPGEREYSLWQYQIFTICPCVGFVINKWTQLLESPDCDHFPFSFLFQVRHLYISGELNSCSLERAATIRRPVNLCRRGKFNRNWQIPVCCCASVVATGVAGGIMGSGCFQVVCLSHSCECNI